jgi:hypothetical protein
MDAYSVGDLVRLSVTFTNAAGTETDPTSIHFKYKAPSDAVVTDLTYGSDPEVVKDSAGVFHVDLSADEAGVWVWRFEGTGAVEQSDEGQFLVQQSDVVADTSAYGEVRERVYAYIADSARTFVTPTDVDLWVKEGIEDLSSRLRMAQDEATGTTSGGTIDIPADFLEPISLRVGSYYAMWVSNDTFHSYSSATQDVDPIARVFNGQIEVYPTTDAAYTLRYWSLAGDMSLLRGNLKLRLVNYVVSRAKAKEGDYRASEYFLGLYERGLPAPSDTTLNSQPIPDGITFQLGPFDTIDAAHN